jgi:hypothetical protein
VGTPAARRRFTVCARATGTAVPLAVPATVAPLPTYLRKAGAGRGRKGQSPPSVCGTAAARARLAAGELPADTVSARLSESESARWCRKPIGATTAPLPAAPLSSLRQPGSALMPQLLVALTGSSTEGGPSAQAASGRGP